MSVLLQGVKDLMEFMKDKDTLIQVKTRNNQKLLQELDSLVVGLLRNGQSRGRFTKNWTVSW